MILVTTETIPGKKIVKTLGLAKGNTIRARHMGKDIMAGFKLADALAGEPVLISQLVRIAMGRIMYETVQTAFDWGEVPPDQASELMSQLRTSLGAKVFDGLIADIAAGMREEYRDELAVNGYLDDGGEP